jgi:triple functional domain protein
MMDAGRLQNFEGKITAQGKLLLHETLMCTEASNVPVSLKRSSFPKSKEFRVFLFEQNIIFSEIVGKKTQFTNPAYIYRSHIQVNKMKMQEQEENGVKKFIIECTDPKRSGISFSCTAPTTELHDEWVQTINKQLQKQLALVDALTDPKNYL